MRMSGMVRREEVESWSQLASLIPPGQQLHTLQAAYGEGGGSARVSSILDFGPIWIRIQGYDSILEKNVNSFVAKKSFTTHILEIKRK